MSINRACPVWCHTTLAMHDYACGDYANCFAKVKMINMPGAMWLPLMRLASGAFLDKREECDRALVELLEIHPDFRKSWPTILSHNMPCGEMLAKMRAGFARAGLITAGP